MEENNYSPELKDIIEMIYRYCASNKNNVIFVYGFLGFKKDPEHKCVDCGDDCEQISDDISTLGAYGDIYSLRGLLNDLRDMVEGEKDSEDFVNC